MERRLEFTVILPVCHGGRFLRNALSSLSQVDFPQEGFEVLVVGAHDDEESRSIVEAESARASFNITYIGCAEPIRSKELNAACGAARGRVLVFADDDCIFYKGWLKKFGKVLECEPDVGVIGGQDELAHSVSVFDFAMDSVLNSFSGTGGLRRGAGPRAGKYYPRLWNMAVPHDVATEAALKTEEGPPHVFNESLSVHEDVDLANRIERLGRKIVFAPDVRIGHHRDTTFRSFVIRNFTMARTSRALGVHRFPHMMLTIFFLGVLVLAASSIFFQPSRIVLLICVVIYMALLLMGSIRGFRRTRRLMVLMIIPFLLVSLHLSRGLGYLFPWRNLGHAKVNL